MIWHSKLPLALSLYVTLATAIPTLPAAPTALETPVVTDELLKGYNVSESAAAFNWTAEPEFLDSLDKEASVMELKYIADPVSYLLKF